MKEDAANWVRMNSLAKVAVAMTLFLCGTTRRCCGQVDPLTDIILYNEEIVNQMAVTALATFRQRCPLTSCTGCTQSACGSQLTQTQCSSDYGAATVQDADNGNCLQNCTSRNLDFQKSVVRTADFTLTQEIVTEECWTRTLDNTFIRNFETDRTRTNSLRWQYIGTPTGFYRILPGVTQEACFSYDPRIRPWYVAATSGPKNVILVIDVSSSMNNFGRIELAREAAISVVNTLTNSDFVGVVLFSDDAEQLLILGQRSGSLLPATNDNILALTEQIGRISTQGQTNFEAAFRTAFSILATTRENSANCHSAILFLTDGNPTTGNIQSESGLTTLVSGLNKVSNGVGIKATIFTFTLGGSASQAIPLAIACGNRGIFSHVDDGGNLRQEMSRYYEYYATLRQAGDEEVVWVEPYIDASGAGLLVTASKAVYDTTTNPPRLIGVVAVDTLVSSLEAAGAQIGADFNSIVRRLALRNTCPTIPIESVTECQLNLIRVADGGVTCGALSESCSEPASSACLTTPRFIDYCFYQLNRFSNPQLYRKEACCGDFTKCSASLINNNMWVLALLLLTGLAWNAVWL